MKMEAQHAQDLPMNSSDGSGKDSAAARLFDELGHSSGAIKDFRVGAVGGGDRVKELLPTLHLENSDRKASSINVGFDLDLHGAGAAPEQLLPSGDRLAFAKGYQALTLPSGESISVNSSGEITMVGADGRLATMIDKRTTPPDMMPSLVMGEFSNGVRLTSAGGLNILNYPDGTSVFLDRTGLRAVDRVKQPRIQLDSQNPDFEFRGFK